MPDLRLALEGRVKPHHRFLLTRILAPLDFLEEALQQLQQEIEHQLSPCEEAMTLAQRVIGIHETSAAAILAEMGTDRSRFPSDTHLASWAGVCPGHKQSGGKTLSSKTRPGNPYLKAILAEVVWVISHTKGNDFSAQSHRIARRRGKQKAITAVSQSVLVILSHIFRDKQPSSDLGGDSFDQLDSTRLQRHHVHRLEQLGDTVTLAPQEVASSMSRSCP